MRLWTKEEFLMMVDWYYDTPWFVKFPILFLIGYSIGGMTKAFR